MLSFILRSSYININTEINKSNATKVKAEISSMSEDAVVAVMDVMHSCRCCLRCAPDRDLTTPYTHLGTTEIYSDMLRECLNLHLGVGGDGSCGICSPCVGRLRDARDFKLQVQRSQAELRARLQGAPIIEDVKIKVKLEKVDMDDAIDEPICDVLYEEPVEMLEVDKAELGEVVLRDPLFESELADNVTKLEEPASVGSEGLVEHVSALAREQLATATSARVERPHGVEAPHASRTSLATLHESRRASRVKEPHDNAAGLRAEEAYTCDTCGKHFTGKSSFIAHVRSHLVQDESAATYSRGTCPEQSSGEYLSDKHTQTHTPKITYSCDMCNRQIMGKLNLISHIKTHMNLKRYSCAVCEKTFKKSSVLQRHKLIHIGVKPNTSEVCNTNFTTKGNLRKHKKVHNAEQLHDLYSCEKCHKKFTQKLCLNKHINKFHTEEKPFRCEECHKIFIRKYHLIRHKRIHSGEKPYTCEECNKQFTHKHHLCRHKRIHIRKNPYSCEECNANFIRKGSLAAHKRIHLGEKPFSCEECNTKFTRQTSLNIHKRIHTGIKPYTCEKCDKRFSKKFNLNVHKRMHFGEKPYSCEVCYKCFTVKPHLTAHQRVHTGEKPFTCEECNRHFAQKQQLTRHKRIHTGKLY